MASLKILVLSLDSHPFRWYNNSTKLMEEESGCAGRSEEEVTRQS